MDQAGVANGPMTGMLFRTVEQADIESAGGCDAGPTREGGGARPIRKGVSRVLGDERYVLAANSELTMHFFNHCSAPTVALLFCGRMIGRSLLILMAAGTAFAASDPSVDRAWPHWRL